MCALSVIADYGISRPLSDWGQPSFQRQFEQLAKKAHEFDVATGQPGCEMDEKRKAIKAIADQLGVEIEFPQPLAKLGTGELRS